MKPNENNVFLTLPLAPDTYFTPPTEFADEQAALREQYAAVLAALEPRMTTAADNLSYDALKMFLKFQSNLLNNPDWSPELMQRYLEMVNRSTIPVVDMTWQP